MGCPVRDRHNSYKKGQKIQMYKKLKICAGAVSALIAFSSVSLSGTGVFAAYSQKGSDGLYISGNTTCKESGKLLGIDLYAPGKSYSDLYTAADHKEYTGILVHRFQVKTGEDGFYERDIRLNSTAKSGVYKLNVFCECGESIKEEDVAYSNPAENAAALALLKAAGSTSELITICNDNKYALGFVSEEELNSVSAQVLYAYIKSSEFNLSDSDIKAKAIKEYNRALAIANISGGKVNNVFDEAERLGLDDSRIGKFYKESFVKENFKSTLTADLKNKNFASRDDFFNALYKSFVLTTVKMSNGYINIVNVVNEFKSDIGLSSDISKEQALKVMNNTYADYAELKTALNKTSGGGGGGGGGGSFGGGSSSSSGNGGGRFDASFGGDYTDNEKAETINKNIFDDIDDVEWARNSIVELAQLGIINGKTINTFCPNDNITREEFIKLVIMAFVPEAKRVPADVWFSDVPDGEWYSDVVKVAYGLDIVKGVGEDRFGTGEYITRQDAAVMVYNTALKMEMMTKVDSASVVFGDEDQMGDYAKDAVYTLAENGIINGVDGVNFAPIDNLTRAEAAKIIYGVYISEY